MKRLEVAVFEQDKEKLVTVRFDNENYVFYNEPYDIELQPALATSLDSLPNLLKKLAECKEDIDFDVSTTVVDC